MIQSGNSLTKHLYRKDEVISSLRWAIITRNIIETAFWAIEVYDSNLLEDGLQTLETLWLQVIGFGSWYALNLVLYVYNQGEVSQEEFVDICCAFARITVRDSTIFHLLIRGTITTDWKPNFPHSMEYSCATDAITDCLKRGKLIDAWLIGRTLEPSEQWLILEELGSAFKEELQILKGLRDSKMECLAAAYVLVSLDELSWIACQGALPNIQPVEVGEAIEDWLLEQSMRKRRVYKPRAEALLYLTDRSSVSTEQDIQEDFEKSLKASEYWSEVMEPYMKNEKWASDLKKEKFYSKYFPQDIPDEWSLADREKSHGRGLGKNHDQARVRFIHHTLQRSKSLELWDSKFPSDLDCSMDWDLLYSVKPVLDFPMKPVKKKFDISHV